MQGDAETAPLRTPTCTTTTIEVGVPAPVISTALSERFASQGSDNFADRSLSAMRGEFGGHAEKRA